MGYLILAVIFINVAVVLIAAGELIFSNFYKLDSFQYEFGFRKGIFITAGFIVENKTIMIAAGIFNCMFIMNVKYRKK